MTELTASRIREVTEDIVAAHAAVSGKSRIDADEATEAQFAQVDSKVNQFLGELAAVPSADDRDLLKHQIGIIFNGEDGDSREAVHARFADPEFIDSLLPEARAVAAARHLLAIRRVTFNPLHANNWDAFSTRFQDAILQA